MKQISITDSAYRALSNDAKRRKLKVEELIDIILKREYQLK
jgi:hypothetical protein